MRLIKLALISLIILFGIVTAISLIIPSDIRLAKVITIRPEKDSIFALLKNKERWHLWHPSFLNGANDSILSNVTTSVVSENDSLLVLQWQQPGKKALNMGFQLIGINNLEPATLQWYMDFKTSWYPWQKIGSLFYESNYGVLMEKGLLNIKQEIESRPK